MNKPAPVALVIDDEIQIRRFLRAGFELEGFVVQEQATGAAVIVCPGGGHHILAWDLEGTEVAEWLNSLGVTAFVLKYRVPARSQEERWRAAVGHG